MLRIFLALVLVLSWPQLANAKLLGEQYRLAGNWIGGAYADDNTGVFARCIMSASYQNGIDMFFAVNRSYGFEIGFTDPRWSLTNGQQAPVSYQIDSFPVHNITGKAISAQMVTIGVESTQQVFSEFQKGYRLRVAAAGQVYPFNLNDTYRALSNLLQCTANALNQEAGNTGNPFLAKNSSTAEDATTRVQQQLEATTFVANLLSAANIPSFRILARSEIPSAFVNRDVVWVGDGIVGMLTIVPPGLAKSADEVASVIIGADAQDCKGEFASGAKPLAGGPAVAIKEFFTSCKTANAAVVQYSVIPLKSRGFYTMAHIVQAGPNASSQDQAKVAKMPTGISPEEAQERLVSFIPAALHLK